MVRAAASPDLTRAIGHFAHSAPGTISAFPTGRYRPAGYEVLRQGEPVDSVYFIERGLVKLVRAHPDGREERIVGLRSRGWILGAAAAIAREPFVVTAITVTPSLIARLSRQEFERLLASDPTISRCVHQMHAREVCAGLAQIGEDGIPARKRLQHFLSILAPADGRWPPPLDDLPLRQWEIAQLVGVTRQYLCRLMAELAADRTK